MFKSQVKLDLHVSVYTYIECLLHAELKPGKSCAVYYGPAQHCISIPYPHLIDILLST
jgi:hypothetical protein